MWKRVRVNLPQLAPVPGDGFHEYCDDAVRACLPGAYFKGVERIGDAVVLVAVLPDGREFSRKIPGDFLRRCENDDDVIKYTRRLAGELERLCHSVTNVKLTARNDDDI